MRNEKWLGVILLAAVVLSAPTASFASAGGNLEEQVQQRLMTLPNSNVFDSLSFRVDNGTVILSGQVTQAELRSDAERLVRNLEGVKFVRNEIETLPDSSVDNQIRWNAYRAIYGYGPLERYSVGAIHIIVKNGNIRLAGVVANDADRTLAYVRVSGVPGVVSVTNDLRVIPRRLTSV